MLASPQPGNSATGPCPGTDFLSGTAASRLLSSELVASPPTSNPIDMISDRSTSRDPVPCDPAVLATADDTLLCEPTTLDNFEFDRLTLGWCCAPPPTPLSSSPFTHLMVWTSPASSSRGEDDEYCSRQATGSSTETIWDVAGTWDPVEAVSLKSGPSTLSRAGLKRPGSSSAAGFLLWYHTGDIRVSSGYLYEFG